MAEAEPVRFMSPTRKAPASREQRPWGQFEVLLSGPGFQVKRLTVKPLKRLSLQWHRHREEHWAVARGTAKVTIDGVQHTLGRGQAMDVPRTAVHRIENISSIDNLEIIELQTGDYLGEDDIVRIEDDFGRADSVPARN
jgi:mannose-1-phosphate guanylyltransferase